jgi:hypothetical protein
MKLMTLAALATLASGCGSSAPVAHRTAAPPAGKAQQPHGPPRAWLETSHGNRWLGGGSYCWRVKGGGLCADAMAPSCEQRFVPHFSVSPGETVRAHLGFLPERASLGGEAGTVEPSTLHGRTLEWKISKGGVFSVFATVPNGDASYVGCLDLTS